MNAARKSRRADAWPALLNDPEFRKLRAHLRDRATMRKLARRADELALFLDLANRPAEALAARDIADDLRQALR